MTTSAKERLRFTHLELRNWRNFTRVDIDLPRRTFLVGPNASGKSNLLDVFRFLRDIASVGGGFQETIRLRKGVSAIRCLAARRHPEVRIRVVLGNEEQPRRWEYDLEFKQDNNRRPFVDREIVTKEGTRILSRPLPEDEDDPERQRQTFLEQVNVNKEFREVAEFFATVRYLHLVPQLVRDPGRSTARNGDPYGSDFLEQVARTRTPTRDARLRRIREALQVAVPQLADLMLFRDDRGVPHLRGKYEHWRPQGAWQEEDQFSDGTLRLMGLLWAVLDGAGPLLLEEPELSLHPEVVRFIPQMFARIQRRTGRQVLVSTHSSELLQDTGIGLDEVLLLIPDAEGTSVRPADTLEEVPALLEGGLSLAEALLPHTSPSQTEQLTLFGE